MVKKRVTEPRARPVKKYELAEKDYKAGMKYAEIAEKYKVRLSTVKAWKVRYWSDIEPAKKKKRKSVAVGLTDKEEVFCFAYVECWNGTQAALNSGISSTRVAAANRANELLKRPDIQIEIKRLKKSFCKQIKVDINDLLKYCLKIVYADIGNYVKFGQREEPVMGFSGPVKVNGKVLTKMTNYIDLIDSDKVDTSVISEIKIGKDGSSSIKLADKKWAWEIIIKYFDLVPDNYQRNIDKEHLSIEKEKLAISKIKSAPPKAPEEPLVLQPFYGKPPEEENNDYNEVENNGD